MPTKSHKGAWVKKGEDPSINWASGKRQNVIAKEMMESDKHTGNKQRNKEGRSSKAHNIWAKKNKAKKIKKVTAKRNKGKKSKIATATEKQQKPDSQKAESRSEKKLIAKNKWINDMTQAKRHECYLFERNANTQIIRSAKHKGTGKKQNFWNAEAKEKPETESEDWEKQWNPDQVRHLFNLQKRR